MRAERAGLALAALLVAAPLAVRAQGAGGDPGLAAATLRYPPMILAATVRAADAQAAHARPCPGAGARVEQRGGPAVVYAGAEPGQPELCRMLFDGQPASAWFGIWLTIWPGAEQARPVLARLVRGRAGDIEGFVVRMTPDLAFYDILRNEGFETLSLLGRTYRTVKVSHYREGLAPNTYRSVVTGWKDLDTGIVVYVTYQHISGAPETATPLDPTRIVTAP